VLVGESTNAYLMGAAWCAGATGWLNFKLRDNGDNWLTGLANINGSPKPAWEDFRSTAAQIRAGSYDCSAPVPPIPPPGPGPTPIPTHNAELASRLAETGAWTSDAYFG
jgi:hypothetical protein